jgi:hypothetical protein
MAFPALLSYPLSWNSQFWLELANVAVDDLAWIGVQILEMGPCRGQIWQRSEITSIFKQISIGMFEISPDLQRLASKRVQLLLFGCD